MQQLSAKDAMFLHMDMDGFPMHTGTVAIYRQNQTLLRYRDILDKLRQRLHRSPVFRRKLIRVPGGVDRPYWVDDPEFDLEFHVRHIALPQPGDWRQLCIQLARLHAQPLDMGRPLWQIYVIEGLNRIDAFGDNCYALYIKVHQSALGDAAGMNFFASLNDIEEDPATITSAQTWEAKPPPSLLRMMGRAYVNTVLRPLHLLRFLRSAVPARRRLRKGLSNEDFAKLGGKQPTRFNGKVSSHRVVDAVSLDLDAIRFIRKQVEGATVNDVVLSVISGALRHYLQSKGELPQKSLVAGCPVDIRDEAERRSAGNMIGLMNVDMRTDIDHPLRRLEVVHREGVRARAYATALGPRVGMELADTVPGGIISTVMRLVVAADLEQKTLLNHTMVTNVPGASYPLYFCGTEMVHSFGIGSLAPAMGLFHSVSSGVFGGRKNLSIAYLACRELLPDPENYSRCLAETFTALLSAAEDAAEEKAEEQRKRRRKRSEAAQSVANARQTARSGAKAGAGKKKQLKVRKLKAGSTSAKQTETSDESDSR